MEIKQNLISENKYYLKSSYGELDPQSITVHNTANVASAKNEILYMVNNDNEVSYHYAVDDIEIWQGVPLNRTTHHSGTAEGNKTSISIEICYSNFSTEKEKLKFLKAEKLAVKLIAKLLQEREWKIERVKRHYDWNGKYCPHATMDLGWGRFIDMVKKELDIPQNGWRKNEKGWWFSLADGKFKKNEWFKDNGKWYYFNNEGYMLSNQWGYINKKWYFFNPSGDMRTGWIRYRDTWYYLNEDSGNMISDEFRKIDNKWYKFNEKGEMLKDTTLEIDKDGFIKEIKNEKEKNK